MYASVTLFLWFLLSHWKCCVAIGNSTSSEDIKAPMIADYKAIESVHSSIQMYVNQQEISQVPSPGKTTQECAVPWSCCDHQNQDIFYGIVKCGKQNTLSVLNGYCLTIDKESTLEAGRCLYNYDNHNHAYIDLPTNESKLKDFMCNVRIQLNRTGTLCGKCQDGYYPLAYSYDMTCVQCPNGKSNWWKFVLAAFLPLTIFCIIILFFNVNVMSSRFQGFLFYSQIISTPALIRAYLLCIHFINRNDVKGAYITEQSLAAFYGIWNLDFFRSLKFGICLGTDTLQTLALDLIVGVYPLLLMVVSYVLIELYDKNFRPLVIMWKPFRRLFGLVRENWNLRTSIIDSFATTFILVNVKFQSVSFDLLTPVTVYHIYDTDNWTYSYRLYYDATVPYFGSRHLPYAITAVMVIMLFIILPILLLTLYPFRCFQKFLNLFPIRWYILHTFVDSFYGSYKDGTQPGTRDCRWFASIFFLSRFCLMLAGAYTESAMYFPIASMVLVAVALLLMNVCPFKENSSHFTTINVCYVLLLALLHICLPGHMGTSLGEIVVIVVAAIFPLLYMSTIILHWLHSQQKFGTDLMAKLRAWRKGYNVIHS